MKKKNSQVTAKIAATALIAAHDLGTVVKWACVVAEWLAQDIILESGVDAIKVGQDGIVRSSHCGGRWTRLSDAWYEPPKGGWKVARPSEAAVYGLANKTPPVHRKPNTEGCYTATGCGGSMPSSILRW